VSYKIGIDAINLRSTPRIAHTEYLFAEKVIRHVLSEHGDKYKELLSHSNLHGEGMRAPFSDLWDYDFLWYTNDGPLNWANVGRVTDLGHSEYIENGDDKRSEKSCPFSTPEEVLAFDAVKEFGLPDSNELVKYYQQQHNNIQNANPNQVVPGGYYKTLVSGAIDIFGWDMLLMAAAEQDRFERVLDSIFQLSLHHYKAWAKTSIEVFLSHDDMVWTAGAFMHPDFYRRVIFPRYQQLWAVLKNAGKKVIYCSDGTWTEFVDDIVDAGADGLLFEPTMSLKLVAERYGKTHVLLASQVDCRTLTFGTKDEIAAEIDATLEVAMDCPGLIFSIANHIPANVPLENALFYFDHLRARWSR
jgi:hypothetical protein